ncbi:hypothetical protein BKA93DRAFT_923635 [Sparassis latifolia]|uniref:Zn(2)-C6 fungal-type domain-containing protein n=1 Tax=Sparassis crispa TaxID=139825 RepID=A0A401H6F3_9APHY|nr:hypothetical protein SCP_1800260 [Sparassis crispa]GBE90004.1 hypothetical protein SCP_1800260 [Sparassis crispa]
MSAPGSSTKQDAHNHSASGDDEYTPRTPRRTPMACQFCRGRKMKCDGRQVCSNCNRRGIACTYAPVESNKVN